LSPSFQKYLPFPFFEFSPLILIKKPPGNDEYHFKEALILKTKKSPLAFTEYSGDQLFQITIGLVCLYCLDRLTSEILGYCNGVGGDCQMEFFIESW